MWVIRLHKMTGPCEKQHAVCRWLIKDSSDLFSQMNAGSGGPKPGKEARPGEDDLEIFSMEKIKFGNC